MSYDVIKSLVFKIGKNGNEVNVDADAVQKMLKEMLDDPEYGTKISVGAKVALAWSE